MNLNLEPVVFALMGQKKEPVTVQPADTFDAVVAQTLWQQRQFQQQQAEMQHNINAAAGMAASILLG